jgi:hypothetical protein
MKASVINNHGQVLQMLNLDQFSLSNYSTVDGTFVVGLHPETMSDYWDGNAFVSIGEPPSTHHTFDYTTKQWIDPRSLDEIKAQKWDEIKSQRDQLEFGGFEFEGNTYDSDQVSQGRIMGAAAAEVDQIWTLANNTTVELSASQLQQLYAALQTHIAGVHERGRIARQLIFEAETKEQVESIQL